MKKEKIGLLDEEFVNEFDFEVLEERLEMATVQNIKS